MPREAARWARPTACCRSARSAAPWPTCRCSARSEHAMTDTVLIVDDSLTVRMDLAEALRGGRASPAVLCAPRGRGARRARARADRAGHPRRACCPTATGSSCCRRSAHSTGSAPSAAVLMLSTEAEVKDRIRGLQTGADDTSASPTTPATWSPEPVRCWAQPATARPTAVRRSCSSTTAYLSRGAAAQPSRPQATTWSPRPAARRACALAASLRPTAIVVDGVLPGIDGATVDPAHAPRRGAAPNARACC